VVAPLFAQSFRFRRRALRYEVASIKRNNGDAEANDCSAAVPAGRGFEGINVTLGSVIRLAYGLQDFQMVGGPKWVDTDRFDIQVRGPQGATESEAPRRLQSLLAERFALKAHMDTRDHPIYALVLARADRSLGPRLRRSQSIPRKVKEQDAKALREESRNVYAAGSADYRGSSPRELQHYDGAAGEPFSDVRRSHGRRSDGPDRRIPIRSPFRRQAVPGAGPGGGFPFPTSLPDPDARRSSPHSRNSSGSSWCRRRGL
jgi:hypothetical protein